MANHTGKRIDLPSTFRATARDNPMASRRKVTLFMGAGGTFFIDQAAMDYVIPGTGGKSLRDLALAHTIGNAPGQHLFAALVIIKHLTPRGRPDVPRAFGRTDSRSTKVVADWVESMVDDMMKCKTFKNFPICHNMDPMAPVLTLVGGNTKSNAIAILRGFAAGCRHVANSLQTTYSVDSPDATITSVVDIGPVFRYI
jgi:hypothetical protein